MRCPLAPPPAPAADAVKSPAVLGAVRSGKSWTENKSAVLKLATDNHRVLKPPIHWAAF
jgi:hypothetical protein